MAYNLGIRFSRKDLRRFLSAVRRVKITTEKQSKSLPRTHATEYYQLVHRNILNQRYGQSYPAYTKRYAEWKAKVAASMDFWRLYGALLKNLKAFRVDGQAGETAYMGGITDSVTSKGKSIAMYGKVVERKRPLFSITALEYAYKPWKNKAYESLNTIKKAWR